MSVLSESLQRGTVVQQAKQQEAPAPQIFHFDVQLANDVNRGSELAFNLKGTPGSKADIKIDGVQGHFFLDEVRSGEYTGIYTIGQNDHIMPASPVLATLRVGQNVST